MRKGAGARFEEIDGLRGVAILMVTMLHIWSSSGGQKIRLGFVNLTPYFWFGQCGVWLFFAISGFCLYYPIAIAHRRGETVDWRSFFVRRSLRIMPAYLAAIAVWLYIAPPKHHLFTHLWRHLTFTHIFWRDSVYSISPVMWSLATEVHFYLLLPFLAFLFRRRPLWTAGVMYLSSISLAAIFTYLVDYRGADLISTVRFGMWFPAQAGNFAAGMLAAHILASTDPERLGPRLWALGLLGASYLIVLPHLEPTLGYFERWTLRAVCAPALGALIVAAVGGCPILSRLLRTRSLRWIGLASYSLYLYNHLFRVWVPLDPSPGSPEWWVSSCLVVLAAGTVSFFLVELPTMRARRSVGRTRDAVGKERALPAPLLVEDEKGQALEEDRTEIEVRS